MANRIARALALASIVGLSAAAAHAASPALVSFTGGTPFATFQANGDTIGWSFSVDRPIIVTHLGYYDGDGTANLQSHPVGIWTSSGTLLTSNVVQTTSPLTGGFRYEPTANVAIPAGTYHLGAFVAANNTTADAYYTSTTARTLSPGFTGLAVLRDPDGVQTDLVFPSVTTTPWTGRFGPNLMFEEIPEPASMGLFAGAMLLAGRRRR